VRLTIGSGPHYAPGWVNVDRNNLASWAHPPDVLGDVLEGLPFGDGAAEAVYLGHVLEHLPWALVPRAIDEVVRLLRPGGELAVVGPCLEAAVRTRQPAWLLESIVAEQDPDATGCGHAWTSTGLLAFEACRHPGLEDLRHVDVASVRPPTWPNPSDAPWQFALVARRRVVKRPRKTRVAGR
jgi:SAM-dependent methyltransferase